MAYIGNDLRSNEDYKIIDDISSGFNGSETSFALQVGGATPVPFPKFEQQLLISVNGVIQEPDPTGSAGFKLLGTNIVFSSAPTNGHAFFGVIYAGADYVNAGGTFPDGSINFPSITFSADTNTGFTRTASGTVALISDGTKVAQFPTSQGSSGQALITDGGGNLSFGIPTNIVNANINASAAIAGTKISPDFGSQAIATTGSATIGTDLIHAGDTDTKISFSTDTISVATNGVTRMTFSGNFIDLPDAGTLRLGNSNDLQISHGSGGASNIVHSNTSQPLNISATGAGNIAFLTNSNERMRVDSSGRLLIGTTTNTFTGVGSSRLQVSGTGADTAGANFIRTSNDGGGAYLQFTKNRGSATQSGDTVGAISWMGHDGTDTESYFAQILVKAEANATNNNTQGSIRFGTSNGSSVTSERMRLTHDGKVGIGITNPTGKLAVSDGTVVAEINPFSASSGAFIGTRSNHAVLLKTNATERMRIEAGGQLLIGHSSSVDVGSTASAKTQIHTSNSTLQLAIAGYGNNSGGAIFALGHSRSGTVGNATGALQDNDEIGTIRFAASDGTDMENTAAFISGIVDGSVSGNSTPGELALGVNNGAGSNANCILIRSDFDIFLGGASGANRMFQSNSKGFIYDHDGGGQHPFIGVQHGVKTTGAAAYISFQSQTSERGKIAESNNGNNVTYNTSSDYRLKQDEVLISDGITRLKQLKPYQFKWKDNLEYGYVDGFFAHEVGDVIKGSATGSKDEVVTQEGLDDGTYNKNRSVGDMVAQGLDYSRLTPLLTAALQEAISKIETLETKVAALEAA